MEFIPNVERWRELVSVSADTWGVPVDIVLSVIHQESRGEPGLRAYKPMADGSFARGLMQVTSAVVDAYERETGTPVDHEEDMGSPDEAVLQIDVGTWYLAKKYRQVTDWLSSRRFSDGELMRFALFAYTAGFHGLQSQLSEAKDANSAGSWSAFANWAKRAGNARAAKYADEVAGRGMSTSFPILALALGALMLLAMLKS